jgi:dipeptidyl aminopeptidase/acylaminoacyl peptidase
MFMLAAGWAVLDGPAFPILGHGEQEPNDSFIQQLTDSAAAAIDAVVGLGVADRAKMAVGGHSYGAFMTSHLLSHTDLFAAGLARSGAYNRSLTPFGFQSEQRHFWDDPELCAPPPNQPDPTGSRLHHPPSSTGSHPCF